MKEIRAFLYVCALLMQTVFKSVVMSNIHTVCSFKSFLSAAIPPHKSPEMSPNLGDLSRDLTLPVWRSESTTTRPCFNYRKPIWLRRYLCLIYSMSYQTIKTLDSFLTSPEILLIYSIICTSRVNILPSGLFFPPSVVSGGDERIPRLRADTCSGAVVMSAPVSLWSFGLENRKTTKTLAAAGAVKFVWWDILEVWRFKAVRVWHRRRLVLRGDSSQSRAWCWAEDADWRVWRFHLMCWWVSTLASCHADPPTLRSRLL